VVGAGSIGASVCADLAVHGFRVVLVDISPAQLDKAKDVLTETVRFGPMVRPDLPRLDVDEVFAAVRFTTRLEDLSDCEFVIENVSEHWETKRDLYRRLDAIVAPEAIFGVNTSSIPIARVAAETSRPGRVIGTHFMNPSYLKEAVEVMRGDETSDECLDHVLGILAELGKEAIVVGDFPGFVSNRISHLFFNEAARVVEEHGVEPAVVDEVFRKCFGHRMGPLETADLIGLDTVLLTLESLHASYGDDRFIGSALLQAKVTSGQLGRKTGQGFYSYSPAQ
jgi:3-hydroxybutyryl-CoA dehydrogenase